MHYTVNNCNPYCIGYFPYQFSSIQFNINYGENCEQVVCCYSQIILELSAHVTKCMYKYEADGCEGARDQTYHVSSVVHIAVGKGN